MLIFRSLDLEWMLICQKHFLWKSAIYHSVKLPFVAEVAEKNLKYYLFFIITTLVENSEAGPTELGLKLSQILFGPLYFLGPKEFGPWDIWPQEIWPMPYREPFQHYPNQQIIDYCQERMNQQKFLFGIWLV